MLPAEPLVLEVARLLPDHPTEAQFDALQARLFELEPEHGLPDIGTRHHFADHLYGRSVRIRPGVLIVGGRHKLSHLCAVAGDIWHVTPGGKWQHSVGVTVLEVPAGTRRVVFAAAETTWFTVHHNPTDSRDHEACEDEIIDRPDLLMSRRMPVLEAA